MERVPKQGQFYRHFKNKMYQIMAVASHSETQEPYVVYQALYGTYGVYIRPLDMFVSEVDHEKYPEVTQKYRFEHVAFAEDGSVYSLEVEDVGKSMMVPESKRKLVIEHKPTEESETSREGEINPDLLAFLEAEGYKAKIEVLQMIRKRITTELLQTMGMSLDFSVGDGELEDQYDALMFYLETHAKYEGNRLR